LAQGLIGSGRAIVVRPFADNAGFARQFPMAISRPDPIRVAFVNKERLDGSRCCLRGHRQNVQANAPGAKTITPIWLFVRDIAGVRMPKRLYQTRRLLRLVRNVSSPVRC
jgi:hypothetical protein